MKILNTYQTLTFLCITLFSGIVTAAPAPKPFTAELTATYGGVKVGDANMALTKNENGQYKLLSSTITTGLAALIKGGTLEEESVFDWHHGVPRALQFESRQIVQKRSFRGPARTITNIDTQVQFDWAKKQATFTQDDKTTNVDLKPGIADRQLLGLSFMSRFQDAAKSQESANLDYYFIDKAHVRHYGFKRADNETLETELGTLECIKLERDSGKRVTTIWLAIALDYFPIRIDKVKKSGPDLSLRVTKLTFE